MPARIRQRDVIKALRQSNGKLEALGRSSVTHRLLDAMGAEYGLVSTLNRRLQEMQNSGTIVVERSQGHITKITLPGLTGTETTSEESETSMPAPKGQKGTTSAQTSDGKPISGVLSDDQVGPVTVRYAAQSAEEAAKAEAEVQAASDMVFEELVKTDVIAMTYQDLALFTRTALSGLYSPAVLQAMVGQVVTWLEANQCVTKKRAEGKKPALYTINRPEVATEDVVEDISDPNKVIRQLLADLSVSQATEAQLNREVTALRKAAENQISSEQLGKILDDLQRTKDAERRLNTENGRLRLDLENARKAHAAELQSLRAELEQATRTNEELQKQLRAQPKSQGLDPEVQARLREMGYGR